MIWFYIFLLVWPSQFVFLPPLNGRLDDMNKDYICIIVPSGGNDINTTTNRIDNHVKYFHTFTDAEGLPFPLYLPFEWKLCLAVSLVICLLVGFRLRWVILSYLNSPESNMGPINYLIWVDQMNGLLYSSVIVVRILTILSPVPLNDLFGKYFGYTFNLLSCIYNSGMLFWSFFIALYRGMFILAQGLML